MEIWKCSREYKIGLNYLKDDLIIAIVELSHLETGQRVFYQTPMLHIQLKIISLKIFQAEIT